MKKQLATFLIVLLLAGCGLVREQPAPRQYQGITTKPYADVLAELEVS